MQPATIRFDGDGMSTELAEMPTVASGVEFGALIDAPPREAWSHETLHFTPWLAANLDGLAREIGIEMVTEETESPVGPFAADLIATNPRDGSRILIENQLGESDHKHLGQIMTYLTGLDARTVIWVATGFRPEHLSAIRWLNSNTGAEFNFFAVKLRVVRIGSSPYAPLFEVVERPNDWDRTVQEVARSSGDLSELGLFRRSFWEHYLARQPEPGARVTADPGRATQIQGAPLLVFQYVAKDRVGIYVRGRRKEDLESVRAMLAAHETALTSGLSATLGGRSSPYFFDDLTLRIDTRERANWDRMADWLGAERQKFVSVLADVLGGAN
jgi:hypothetical protein